MPSSKDNGKGKGRADPEDSDPHPQQDSPSLLSRVAASATGLTRNAFTVTATTTDDLQNAVSASEKGLSIPSTSSRRTAWNESSTSASFQQQQQPSTQTSSSSGLRTGHSEQHAQASEQEFSFFLDGTPSLVPSEPFDSFADLGSRSSFDEAWDRSQTLLAQPSSSRTVAEQERRDGEDVLSLLTTPSVFAEEVETLPLMEEDENYNWGLTPAQMAKLREMTRDILPPPESHRGVPGRNDLSLLPDFRGQDGAIERYLEEWDGVLNRYADEVWGGLLPLVREARQEFEDLKTDESGLEQPKIRAIRRLGAILGHLGHA